MSSGGSRKRWKDDDDELPHSPSMPHKYVPNPLRRLSRSPNPLRRFSPRMARKSISGQSAERENSLDGNWKQRLAYPSRSKSDNRIAEVDDLEERAKRLKAASGPETPSVSDIEERLAKLRGLPVEDIRRARGLFMNQNKCAEESAEALMMKAMDEAAIEARRDRSGRLKWEHEVDPEKFLNGYGNAAASSQDILGEPSTSGADILMGQDTIRNLKDLRRTMKMAKQESMKAAALTSAGTDNQSMDKEMKKLIKLTRQSSVKSEKINEELSKFWERKLDDGSSSESSSASEPQSDLEISDEELQRVILEAEKAEKEVKETVKESKKSGKKGGIFSRIFRS